MRVYSPFFHTLHDETGPVGDLGRGTHYSVLRAIVWPGGQAKFHDFAVIWDEDHDTRVMWTIERLFCEKVLQPVMAIGERKGGIHVVTRERQSVLTADTVEGIAQNNPTDAFQGTLEALPDVTGMIINTKGDKIRSYLLGIDALWQLGTKDVHFS